jgi:hypothetical protein
MPRGRVAWNTYQRPPAPDRLKQTDPWVVVLLPQLGIHGEGPTNWGLTFIEEVEVDLNFSKNSLAGNHFDTNGWVDFRPRTWTDSFRWVWWKLATTSSSFGSLGWSCLVNSWRENCHLRWDFLLLTGDRCHDFENISAKTFCEKIGAFLLKILLVFKNVES